MPTATSTATTAQRIIRKSMRIANRRIKRDVESGHITALQMRDVLHERRLLYADWHKRHSEIFNKNRVWPGKETSNKYSQLDEAWLTRNTRRPGLLNCLVDKYEDDNDECITKIYTQSIANSRKGDDGVSRVMAVCAPGVIMPWTKYFKSVTSIASKDKDAADTFASLSIQPMEARHTLSPKQLPLSLSLSPAPKRLLISRSVSLGKADVDEYENDEDAVQFQTLGATRYSPQPALVPTGATSNTRFDLISSLSSCPELITQVCRYLNLNDVLALYRTSRVFKSTFDSDREHNVQRMARQFTSDETRSIFSWRRITDYIGPLSRMFESQERCMHEVPGRPPQAPSAPTLCYVGMMVSRERKVRDIVATLARAGHRLPRTNATAVLKKMWLLMDIPTNGGRVLLLKDEALFSDLDLLTMQMFHVKLVLHFHDPLMGPDHSLAEAHGNLVPGAIEMPFNGTAGEFFADGDHTSSNEMAAAAAAARDYILQHQRQLPEHSLVETLLGQRGGLDVLWNILRGKAYRTLPEVVALKARYDCKPPTFLAQNTSDSARHERYDSGGFTFEIDPGNDWENLFNTEEGPRNLEASSYGISDEHSSSAETGLLHNFASSRFSHGNVSFFPLYDDYLVDVLGTGVPSSKMGKDHLEGWGKGSQHLLRPDELVSLEAARRVQEKPNDHLDLNCHVPFMAIWGNRDFATGANLLPDVDEMYISDEEHDMLLLDDLSSDTGEEVEDSHENKENLGVHAPIVPGARGAFGAQDATWNRSLSGKEHAAIAALVAKGIDEDMYPMAEHRLQSQCGNVLVGRDEWQPWQVLKARWDTLTLREKVDVWWVSHQYRLHRQAWTQREGQGRRDGHVGQDDQLNQLNQANAGIQAHQTGMSHTSYTQPDAAPNEETPDETDDMDMYVDTETEIEDYDDGDYFAEDEEDRGEDNSEANFEIHSETDDNKAPTPDHGSSQPNTPPDVASLSFSSNLSRRHQQLVKSCVEWALREQDEVDQALLAQADVSYEVNEMAHWDEFLAEAGQMLAGLDIDSLDHEINEEGWLSEEHVAATPMPNPEEVLMPEYGSLNDVLQLVEQVHEAQVDADAAELMARMDEPSPGTANLVAAADVRMSNSKDKVQELTAKLELLLKAEVFAVDL
ncbi:hypothetical protein SEPCBS57363_003522 [Sporothrix epigloea]|uniref:F-box domain-containing protein n=1 Tax=Sporothrix epigloea TaxID=1892477 RepID=A0ABP0DLX4_9PEZI